MGDLFWIGAGVLFGLLFLGKSSPGNINLTVGPVQNTNLGFTPPPNTGPPGSTQVFSTPWSNVGNTAYYDQSGNLLGYYYEDASGNSHAVGNPPSYPGAPTPTAGRAF
jgi:hypothetical protein